MTAVYDKIEIAAQVFLDIFGYVVVMSNYIGPIWNLIEVWGHIEYVQALLDDANFFGPIEHASPAVPTRTMLT